MYGVATLNFTEINVYFVICRTFVGNFTSLIIHFVKLVTFKKQIRWIF